jgi:hypothetical protein
MYISTQHVILKTELIILSVKLILTKKLIQMEIE